MSTNNFEGFKPLSEDEEKQVTGGGQQGSPCDMIAKQISQLQQQIVAMQQQGQSPDNLIQQMQSMQLQYQQCQQNAQLTN